MFMNIRNILKHFGVNLFGTIPDFPKGFKYKGVEVTSSGAEMNALDGVTSSAAALNKLDGFTGTKDDLNRLAGLNDQSAVLPRVTVVPFKTGAGLTDLAGGVFSLVNPAGMAIIVTDVVLDVTTKAMGACTLDVGQTAGAEASADNLLDGVDVGTSIGTFNHVDNKGTNGLGLKAIKVAAGGRLTASRASGAVAGLAGKAYVTYYPAS